MARAAGCSPAARRPAQTPERDGQWQQDRICSQAAAARARAPCAVCAHGAGWNGLRGRSRLRRPPPPPRGSPCARRRPPSASGAGTHRTPQRCAGFRVAASHPTQANKRNSCSNAFGSFRGFGCVFASLRRIASAKETHRLSLVFLFGSALGGNNGCEINHVTFSLSNSSGL